MIAYRDMPVLEQLALLSGAAQQAGVSEALVGELQGNIRDWILDSQVREDYCARNHSVK